MSEAKKYDRSYKEQSVKLALEIGVKRARDMVIMICWFGITQNSELPG